MSRIASTLVFIALACGLAACAAPATSGGGTDTPPPKSTPLPPRTAPQPVVIDSSCRTSADCAVKDVGNCCGTMPACVNKDSPTDPAGVQAQCKAKGMMGVCGFKEISGCQCVNGSCEPDAPEGMPAPQVQ